MNAARMFLRWKEERLRARQGHARVGHPNQHFAGGGKRTGDEDGRGLALVSQSEIVGIFGKGEFAGPGAVGGGQTRDGDGAVADDFALKLLGNLSSGKRHGLGG